jgi:hypothetical protein
LSDAPLIKGGLRGDPPAYRHPPYQGGQGGSNLKSIFNLIITSYLQAFLDIEESGKSEEEKEHLFKEEIPEENIRNSLHLRFHANHIISTICGQPDSPLPAPLYLLNGI